MAETQDASLLKRRARRRLIGAIALVLFAVIVLPIVLDREPGPVGRDLTINIPSEKAAGFVGQVLPPSAPAEAASKAAEKSPPPAGAAGAPPSQTAVKHAQTAGSRKAIAKKRSPATKHRETKAQRREEARVKALLDDKQAWVIQLGAFSNKTNVKQLRDKLAAAHVRNFTEAVAGRNGERTTRVRAGPFRSKAEAERVRKKLLAAGMSPGKVEPQ